VEEHIQLSWTLVERIKWLLYVWLEERPSFGAAQHSAKQARSYNWQYKEDTTDKYHTQSWGCEGEDDFLEWLDIDFAVNRLDPKYTKLLYEYLQKNREEPPTLWAVLPDDLILELYAVLKHLL